MRILVTSAVAIALALSGCALSPTGAGEAATSPTVASGPATSGSAIASPAATGSQSTTAAVTASTKPATPSTAAASPSARATPSVTAAASTAASPSASESASAAPEKTPKPAPDTRKGKQLRTPYQVNGIIVVSKQHRITSSYAPKNPTGPYHLEVAAAKALAKLTAAAKADGVRIRVRSGYRNWATQNAIYLRAKRNYPQNIDYYAPAGASEHQTGLSVDLWDGTTWSLPMAKSAAGKWLFKHAHAYGFVLRYPDGKKKITGYHYEPWHYRYIGMADAKKFGKSNSLTLEEYLGLA